MATLQVKLNNQVSAKHQYINLATNTSLTDWELHLCCEAQHKTDLQLCKLLYHSNYDGKHLNIMFYNKVMLPVNLILMHNVYISPVVRRVSQQWLFL